MSVCSSITARFGLLLFSLIWCASVAQGAIPAALKDGGYAIDAGNMPVRTVLEQFGRTYGMRVQLSGDGTRLMKGRVKAENGVDFLNRLAASHGFRWFFYNGTLYIGPDSDNTSMRMQLGENAVQDAKAALVGLGLFDERFGWGELPDEGVVVVSGPRAYVNLARDVLMPSEKKAEPRGRQVMLFRLKYASAMDRTINSRGKTEVIPGIRTILSNLMLGGHGNSGEKVTGPDSFDIASRKRSRTGKVGRGDVREVSQESGGERFAPLFSAPGTDGRNALMPQGAAGMRATESSDDSHDSAQKAPQKDAPRIEADPTLNAIMIYDDVAKRDMYQSLIRQLDIQPRQVEIEALIVDIDRSKLGEMGVEWGLRAGNFSAVVNGTTTQSQGTDTPLPGATLLISNAARFYARLKALESNGEARVLATPTILTLDNVAAVLDLSQSAFVSLVGERVANMSDITAGTMLRVIPRIIEDGGDTRVRLEVDIEDGSLNGSDGGNGGVGGRNGSGNVLGTNVTRSTINTQAIIDAQQTLMIGGYRAESLIRNRHKTPVLGDLPLVGGLFRSESKSDSTRERLFLITPRITGSDGKRANRQPARREVQPPPVERGIAAQAEPPSPAAAVASRPPVQRPDATPAERQLPAAALAPRAGMPPVPVPAASNGTRLLPAPARAVTAKGSAPALLGLPGNIPGNTVTADSACAGQEPARSDGWLMDAPTKKRKVSCGRGSSTELR